MRAYTFQGSESTGAHMVLLLLLLERACAGDVVVVVVDDVVGKRRAVVGGCWLFGWAGWSGFNVRAACQCGAKVKLGENQLQMQRRNFIVQVHA